MLAESLIEGNAAYPKDQVDIGELDNSDSFIGYLDEHNFILQAAWDTVLPTFCNISAEVS